MSFYNTLAIGCPAVAKHTEFLSRLEAKFSTNSMYMMYCSRPLAFNGTIRAVNANSGCYCF
jgi:hypothetical protein